MSSLSGKHFKVLVTGFGPFLNITTNPSWEIARQLPSTLHGSNGEEIFVVVPEDPIPAAYHRILAHVPELVEQHAPDIIVHMGLEVDNGPGVFKVEKSAPKEGYHGIPDIDRKVLTRAENKRLFGKTPSTLNTTLDIDKAADMWRHASSSLSLPKARVASSRAKDRSKEGQMVDIRLSDDVGTYVCGLNYYSSMLEMQKKTGKRNVVFLHVPKLEGKGEIHVGIRVTEEVIKALVGVCQ